MNQIKIAGYYRPAHKRCISWNDPAIDINSPKRLASQLSGKNQVGLSLVQAEVPA